MLKTVLLLNIFVETMIALKHLFKISFKNFIHALKWVKTFKMISI